MRDTDHPVIPVLSLIKAVVTHYAHLSSPCLSAVLNPVCVMHIKVKLNTLHSTGESYLYTFNYIVKFYLLLLRFGCLLKFKSILKEFFFIGFMRGALLVGRELFAWLWSSENICSQIPLLLQWLLEIEPDCYFIWASTFTNYEPSHQP